jgi:hypothetical protein
MTLMNEFERETFENQSGKISEPLLLAIGQTVGIPLFCMAQYVATFTMVLMLVVHDDRPPAIILLVGLVVCFGVAMLPVWFKTFFKRNYLGVGWLISVEWSPGCIAFRNPYSYIEVSPEDVLSFRTSGFRWINQAFVLKVWIKGSDGSKQRAYLNTTMPGKDKFLSFLEMSEIHKLRRKRSMGQSCEESDAPR